MTDWVYDADTAGNPAIGAESELARTFSTNVEPSGDGKWIAVVALGDGATVSRVFDTEGDALHYGDELAQWLSARRERE